MTQTAQSRKIAIETDTALAALHEELTKLQQRQRTQYNRLHVLSGDKRDRQGRWGTDDETAYRTVERTVEQGEDEPWSGHADALDKLVEIERDIDLANERITELDRIWAEHGWNRYFLVTNSNGHVHRGMSCSTCFATTEYAWLVELADCDEAEMIEEFGEKACTVCFPDAPANPHFNGPGRRDREAQAARQAEKDARNEAKAAKRLAEDEMFKTIYNRDRVETVAACKELIRKAVDTTEELRVIRTPAYAARWTGDSDQLVRLIINVTDYLAQQERDAGAAHRAASVWASYFRTGTSWRTTELGTSPTRSTPRSFTARGSIVYRQHPSESISHHFVAR